MDVIYTLRQ